MFLLNEILVFTPGRRQEAIDRLGWIHGLMASKPGFRQAIVAKYLGDGVRHTVLRIWEDEEAFLRFRQGPDGNYGRGRPPGLYTNDPVVPQWNSILDASGSGQRGRADYLVKVQQAVPEEAWEAFAEHEKQVQEIMLSRGGLVDLRLLRAKDRNESLSIARYEDRAGFERLLDSADYAKALETAPADVSLVSRQCFEVVSDVGPT